MQRLMMKQQRSVQTIAAELDTEFYITGPAGIAGDTVKLFESADLKLLFATIGIILVLLIAIYRSPLLAIIPYSQRPLSIKLSTKQLLYLERMDLKSITQPLRL